MGGVFKEGFIWWNIPTKWMQQTLPREKRFRAKTTKHLDVRANTKGNPYRKDIWTPLYKGAVQRRESMETDYPTHSKTTMGEQTRNISLPNGQCSPYPPSTARGLWGNRENPRQCATEEVHIHALAQIQQELGFQRALRQVA